MENGKCDMKSHYYMGRYVFRFLIILYFSIWTNINIRGGRLQLQNFSKCSNQ